MNIGLVPLTDEDRPRFGGVCVTPQQEVFSGTAIEAFDEAFATAPERIDLHGILADDRPVGLFKIDRDYRRIVAKAQPGALGLRAFMIDHRVQGRGIATAAVRALGPYLARHYPKAEAVDLTVNHINEAALACYRKGGFTDTGLDWDKGHAGPQDLLRMALR